MGEEGLVQLVQKGSMGWGCLWLIGRGI